MQFEYPSRLVGELRDAAHAGTPFDHFSVETPITINISSVASSCVYVVLLCSAVLHRMSWTGTSRELTVRAFATSIDLTISATDCRVSAAGSQADTRLQQHLSALVSQQEVELHAAKLALDTAARQQAVQKQELVEAQAQVEESRREVAKLAR